MFHHSKGLVRPWYEQVWNKGRADTIDELLSERSMVHGLGRRLVADDDRVAVLHQLGMVTPPS